jgi:hypothetical protein
VGDVGGAKRYVFSPLVHYKRLHDLLSWEDKKGIHPHLKVSDYNLEWGTHLHGVRVSGHIGC